MTYQRILIVYLVALVLVQATFAAFPWIDIAVSQLFVTDQGFHWALGEAPTINLVIRRVGEAITGLIVVVLVLGLLTGTLRRTELRLLAYPALCVAIACGVMVNLVLKAHVGRARPHTLVEFGGTAQFTPPWQVAEECARNCSFTSGEAALAAGLAIPAVVILWPHLKRGRARVLAVLVALAYVAVTSLFRIGLGRHFLSDTVFSALFSAGVALILYPLLRIEEARRYLPVLTCRQPVAAPAVEQRGVY